MSESCNKSKIKGKYSYLYSGKFGEELCQSIAEGGIFKSNGEGKIIANGTIVSNGEGSTSSKWICNYTVDENGIASLTCDLYVGDPLVLKASNIKWQMTGGKHGVQFVGLPDPTRTDEFKQVDITGSGIKE